jgi:hypothetical protein
MASTCSGPANGRWHERASWCRRAAGRLNALLSARSACGPKTAAGHRRAPPASPASCPGTFSPTPARAAGSPRGADHLDPRPVRWGRLARCAAGSYVRVMGHRAAPGVQHGCSDFDAEPLWIGAIVSSVRRWPRTGGRRSPPCSEGDGADPRGQRERDMEIGHLQQLGLARLSHSRAWLPALRAMPVATTGVGDGRVPARGSRSAGVPAEGRVRQASIALITLSWACVRWRVARRMQGRDRGRCPRSRASRDVSRSLDQLVIGLATGIGSVRRSSGLSMVRRILVATCV